MHENSSDHFKSNAASRLTTVYARREMRPIDSNSTNGRGKDVDGGIPAAEKNLVKFLTLGHEVLNCVAYRAVSHSINVLKLKRAK